MAYRVLPLVLAAVLALPAQATKRSELPRLSADCGARLAQDVRRMLGKGSFSAEEESEWLRFLEQVPSPEAVERHLRWLFHSWARRYQTDEVSLASVLSLAVHPTRETQEALLRQWAPHFGVDPTLLVFSFHQAGLLPALAKKLNGALLSDDGHIRHREFRDLPDLRFIRVAGGYLGDCLVHAIADLAKAVFDSGHTGDLVVEMSRRLVYLDAQRAADSGNGYQPARVTLAEVWDAAETDRNARFELLAHTGIKTLQLAGMLEPSWRAAEEEFSPAKLEEHRAEYFRRWARRLVRPLDLFEKPTLRRLPNGYEATYLLKGAIQERLVIRWVP